jgi:hypothetical protein
MRNLCLAVFAALFLLAGTASAQELNCKVTINADQIQTSDRGIFKDMERAIATFMNTRKWTSDTYKNHERINCAIFLNISRMPSIGTFSANAQITVARPVFNSNYETVLLNFADRDWDYEYIESLPLEYNDNAYISNLSSMLAYYAYIIIGMDYDSFSERGGDPYFQAALNVVNNAQSSNRPGWQTIGSTRNRYNLVENINNPQMAEMRKSMYRYHRLALDTFDKTPDESRVIALNVLKTVRSVWQIYPSSIYVIAFLDAKNIELANIFSDGALNVRREAYDILTVIDAKRGTYQKIIENK